MSHHFLLEAAVAIILCISLGGCDQKVKADPRIEEPPLPEVLHRMGSSSVTVDHPEQFPLAIAQAHDVALELSVTGTVSPDVSRNVPVVSLASGRVVEIHARLGDEVTKGQLIMRIQSADISRAFADCRKAEADELLADAQLDRARFLYSTGAIARKDLEVAQDTDDKAQLDVEAAKDHLKVLGADIQRPSAMVDILAPISGVITEQNVTAAAGVKTLDNSPNLFTIADISRVWIICDVYENDLPNVHLNESADIRLNAYPSRVFQGRISNIAPVLDPNLRTAKVRIETDNPGLMRLGMFVRATFRGQKTLGRAVVPASAILHLHDRDWVYVPQGGHAFQRVEVTSGGMVALGRQEILSGIRPGDRVVANALDLQYRADQ
jgi:cobalt-zinc-cadmium efflux system membrane fusion protein